MSIDSENELIQYFSDHAVSFDQWLLLMKFGKAELLTNPRLAMELIVIEAQRRRSGCPPTWKLSDVVCDLMDRLGWQLCSKEGSSE